MAVRARPCRHCRKKPGTYRRGLCRPCYSNPTIRASYPSQSAKGRRGLAGPVGPLTVAQPTLALPGTPGKVLVLEDRVRLLQSLWHQHDATLTGDDRRGLLVAGLTPEGSARVVGEVVIAAGGQVVNAQVQWSVAVPGHERIVVTACTKSEARTRAKEHFQIPRKDRLPVGTVVRLDGD